MLKQKILATLALLLIPAACALAQTGPDCLQRYEVAGHQRLIYDPAWADMFITDLEHNIRLIGEYCSYPAVTPDKSKFAYLEPWGFEEVSALWLYDVAEDNAQAVEIPDIQDEYPGQNTAKEILWLDDRFLLIVAGYANGTVTAGGELYYYDDVNETSGKIITCHNLEIANISLKDDKALLDIVAREYYFIVKNYVFILRDEYTEEVALAELRRLIAAGEIMTLAEKPEKAILASSQVLAGWLYAQALEANGLDPVEIMIKRPNAR